MIGSVTLAFSNNGDAPTAPVGSYTITASAATGGTFLASNYSFTYATGTLTVQTRPVTVMLTAHDKQYDGTDAEPNSSRSCSLVDVVSPDNPTCTPTAGRFNSSQVAGATAVTATATISGAGASNYTFGAAGTAVMSTSVTAPASITRRPLDVTAIN